MTITRRTLWPTAHCKNTEFNTPDNTHNMQKPELALTIVIQGRDSIAHRFCDTCCSFAKSATAVVTSLMSYDRLAFCIFIHIWKSNVSEFMRHWIPPQMIAWQKLSRQLIAWHDPRQQYDSSTGQSAMMQRFCSAPVKICWHQQILHSILVLWR